MPTKRKPVSKKDRLSRVQAAIAKKFGSTSAIRLSDGYRGEAVESIPVGLDAVDHYVAGCGGLPVGRIVELYSEEGGGKSSLLLSWMGHAQKLGYECVLAETENGISSERAETFGVNLDDLLILQPEYMEQCLQQLEMVLDELAASEPDKPTLIGWDSLAATPTKAEIDSGIVDKAAQDARSIIMSRAMRVFSNKVKSARAVLVVVNQTRHKRGVMFGDSTTTPGGSALKFHSSLRLQILGGSKIKEGDEHIGKDFTLMAKKNRFAAPYRKCRVRLMYDDGFDNDWTLLNLAKDWGLVTARSRDTETALKLMKRAKWNPRNAKDVLAALDAEDAEKPKAKAKKKK